MEMKEIRILKQWSGLKNIDILFDSDINGDGFDILKWLCKDRRNLYFISIDDKNNVFGGFINEYIYTYNYGVSDEKAFVFSLIRDGSVKNLKYNIKWGHERMAFYLFSSNNPHGLLYQFGEDIIIRRVGKGYCFYKQDLYNYNGEKKALVESNSLANGFPIMRVIVLQMN
ncbi:TLDc domain-containing protein [Entamoeba marina]